MSELTLNTELLSKSVAVLGSTEEDMALSRSLSQLSDVTSKVSLLHADQADVDFYVISELIKDYTSVIQTIKVSCAINSTFSLVSPLFCVELLKLNYLQCMFCCLQ